MIAVDAMGGDFAPKVAVQGAFNAVKNSSGSIAVTLFGYQDVIEGILSDCDQNWAKLPISIVDCTIGGGYGRRAYKRFA